MEALFRYFSGCLVALAALFAPVVPLVWCVVGFIAFDFLTGVLASRADARREGGEWYFTSSQAWHTAEKLGFAIIALCMAYLIDTLMLDFMHLNLTKLFAGFVCGVEMVHREISPDGTYSAYFPFGDMRDVPYMTRYHNKTTLRSLLNESHESQ